MFFKIIWKRKRRKKIVKSKRARAGQRDYNKYKEVARERVTARLKHWNMVYGFPYGRVAIRNQKTRWGSCSIKGNLNFNYKAALLPDELVDYLVVHELCHLKEFNHSQRFWDLVGKAVPEYVTRRAELKKWKPENIAEKVK